VIPGFEDTQSEVSDGREVLFSTPRVFTIDDPNANSVRVTIGFPQMTSQSSNGDINGNTVTIYIDVQTNGAGYVQKISDVVTGKCTSMYEKSYRIPLTGTGPWDIKVSRSADGTGASDQKRTYLNRYTKIIDQKFTYPNSAIMGVQIDASQLDRIPTRGYRLKLLKVQVPTNYDPIARTYTGVWDGTFKVAWTDNPAWCFYDLATNTRYGAGKFLAGKVDKWAMYTIAKYCDELVPCGTTGATAPRFRCNAYFQTSEKAYQVLANLASVFRGMIYSASGIATCVQDAPSDPVAVFTSANVRGKFVYTGSPLTQRHSVALVKWVDPNNGFKEKTLYVEDTESRKRYGYNPTNITAIACTDIYQAYRVGVWALASERTEAEMVTFQTDLIGSVLTPGAIFQIQDPDRAGKSLGGRVRSATTTAVTIDREVVIENGKTYTMVTMLPDGTPVSQAINNPPGPTQILTVSTPLASAPVSGAVWALSVSDLALTTWRLLSVNEKFTDTEMYYEIEAVAHNPSKYDFVDLGKDMVTPNTTSIPVVLTPSGITISEYQIRRGVGTATVLAVAWNFQKDARKYSVQYRKDNGNWMNVDDTTINHIEVIGIPNGVYDVRVVAHYDGGLCSQAGTATYTVLGLMVPPATPTGFSATINTFGILLKWNENPEVDIDSYELRQGTDWATGTLITNLKSTSYQWELQALGSYNLMLKAIDTSGNYSTNPATLTVAPSVTTPASITMTVSSTKPA
jgi:predicted phage tail protein